MHHAQMLIADWSWAMESSLLAGPFDVRAALIVFGVVTVAAAVIIGAAILMPGIGIVGGASIAQTCIEVGMIALATGAVAGAAAGRYQGHKAARQADEERVRRVQEIREVDHFLDVHFLPSQDDADHARDFSCALVSYDASAPDAPVVRTEIDVKSAEGFYKAVRSEFEHWLRKPIRTDGGSRRRHVAIFMKPYPGDGVFERIRELCEHRAEVEISRVEGQWICRLDAGSTAAAQGDSP